MYFVAAVAVLYNVEEQRQRHYLGHTDDIKWYGTWGPLAATWERLAVRVASGASAGPERHTGSLGGRRLCCGDAAARA